MHGPPEVRQTAPSERRRPAPPRLTPNAERPGAPPRRALGLRVKTSFPLLIHDGSKVIHCRTVELSSTGVVVERRRGEQPGDRDNLVRLELFVPNRDRPVRALGRLVRVVGTHHALRFVAINDVDRLTLMEHLDQLSSVQSP